MATPARISHSQIDPVNTKHIFCCFCFCFCCNVNKRSQFFIDVAKTADFYLIYTVAMNDYYCRTEIPFFFNSDITKYIKMLIIWWLGGRGHFKTVSISFSKRALYKNIGKIPKFKRLKM